MSVLLNPGAATSPVGSLPSLPQAAFPIAPWAIPSSTISAGRYLLRFARTDAELDRILRLRYEVFNLELHEGLDHAHLDGRDEDPLDRRFHHLLIEERETGAIVGTYRMQTAEMARAGGWYASSLFALDALPEPVLSRSVEVGRACVAKAHRHGRVLHLLWRGLASYLLWNRKTVLFGCCSLTSQDESYGCEVHALLEQQVRVHRALRVRPRAGMECRRDPEATPPVPRIPSLFQAYLTLGAKVLGPPAIDRDFKTIDWLALLDVEDLDRFTVQAFFR